jgi:DNA-binding transcriptional MerR regulator
MREEYDNMTITEVAEKYDITADTLRYYERIGLIPPVPRNNSGIRNYDEESCRWVELMRCMRKAGVQIEALIEYVALFHQGDSTVDARKQILKEQRNQLAEKMDDIQTSLNRLDEKIERYEQGLMMKEKALQNIRKK